MKALAALSRARDALGVPPWFFTCAALALVALWGHEYPAGVDLPQHASLVRLWVSLDQGPPEYHLLYKVNPFTPYVLAYALAYPFVKWGSGLFAMKVVLSITVLTTPWSLTRWLRVVGAEPRLGLVGFPIALGFTYLWGFLAHGLAVPILFAYLTAFEAWFVDGKQGAPAPRRAWLLLATTVWGGLLFFCHGVTFGVAAATAGVRIVFHVVTRRTRPEALRALLAALHLVPLAVLTVAWLVAREDKASAPPNWWFIDTHRLTTLFSGFFWLQARVSWAAVTLGAIVALLAIAGPPRLNRSPGAWIPFAVASAGFVILPDYMVSTYLVGTRFCVYVQALVLALWLGGGQRTLRLERTLLVMVTASLVLLNVRLSRFNAELDGFRAVAAKVAPGADVQTYLAKLGGDSEVFGARGVAEVPAWLTATSGALIENDSAHYFQMPIQRRPVRFPQRYRYVFVRGIRGVVAARMARVFPNAVEVARSGTWSLYERKPERTGAIEVVRSEASSGALTVDSTSDDVPLSIAGAAFEHGLATNGRSFVRVRSHSLAGAQPVLEGACGVDDTSTESRDVSCRIVGADGATLWDSGPMQHGDAARPFRVPLDKNREALLVTHAEDDARIDWVDLR